MRRSKEIVVLIVLFVVMAAGVLWYVIDRRAKNRALPPVAARTLAPEPPAPPVALGTPETEHKTIDYSSGKPVVKDSPEDKAALDAGLKDIADATKDVSFGPTPPPKPASPKK
jgi:hypothetical protein